MSVSRCYEYIYIHTHTFTFLISVLNLLNLIVGKQQQVTASLSRKCINGREACSRKLILEQIVLNQLTNFTEMPTCVFAYSSSVNFCNVLDLSKFLTSLVVGMISISYFIRSKG